VRGGIDRSTGPENCTPGPFFFCGWHWTAAGSFGCPPAAIIGRAKFLKRDYWFLLKIHWVSISLEFGCALEVLEQSAADILLVDLKLPVTSGLELLKRVSELYPQLSVIVLTQYGTIDSAIEATRIGARRNAAGPGPTDCRGRGGLCGIRRSPFSRGRRLR
jgi:hypothetical protein